MSLNIIISEIRPKEIYKLEDMLYQAIYQPDENNLTPRCVLEIPEVNAYIKDFGKRADDHCLVADLDGEVIGAVWIRIISGEIKGFGYLDDLTPEFTISLFKEYRGQGIGTCLMKKMIDYMRKLGYKQASLSVQKENYAVKLYLKMGFKIIREKEKDYLMMLKLH